MLANEAELLNLVFSFFAVGNLKINPDGTADYVVTDLDSLSNIIIPRRSFEKYPLRGTKYYDFSGFKEAVAIFVSKKKHRTEEGLKELSKIHYSLNTFRKFAPAKQLLRSVLLI